MKRGGISLRRIIHVIWIILVGCGIYFLANAYLKEVELIYNSAKLEILEESFAFHPNIVSYPEQNKRILYLYLLSTEGSLVYKHTRSVELMPEAVKYPELDLRFTRQMVGGREVLQLEKILRRGRDEEEKQGLIIGMDYGLYSTHEKRAFIKYSMMFITMLGLIFLAYFGWQRWLRIQAEMALNERFIYTGKLSRQIAHEIKNPLGVMQAAVDYIRELNDPEMMKAELTDIGTEIQRLNRLVERIRSFAGTEKPDLQTLELGEFLQDFTQLIQHRYQGLIVSFAEEQGGIRLNADRDQLTQVLFNLIQNADESYGPEVPLTERKILLGLRAGKKSVEIFVQDWGEPVPAEVRGRIFDPFVTSKVQGSGLGLAISRQIIKAHAGKISLHTEDGTKRFSVVLPIK